MKLLFLIVKNRLSQFQMIEHIGSLPDTLKVIVSHTPIFPQISLYSNVVFFPADDHIEKTDLSRNSYFPNTSNKITYTS